MVSGSLAIRESAITRETDIRYLGAVCLNCGNRQDTTTGPLRHYAPTEWELSFRGDPGDERGVAIAQPGPTAEPLSEAHD